MRLTLKTATTELHFEMTGQKAEALIHQAFTYANNAEAELPAENTKPSEAPKPTNKPGSKLERMFGDWKSRMPEPESKEAPQDEPTFYKGFFADRVQSLREKEGLLHQKCNQQIHL